MPEQNFFQIKAIDRNETLILYLLHFSMSFVVSEIIEEIGPCAYLCEFLYSTINKVSSSHLKLGLNAVSVICASSPSLAWIFGVQCHTKTVLAFRYLYKSSGSGTGSTQPREYN
jgi:hypothetical protein